MRFFLLNMHFSQALLVAVLAAATPAFPQEAPPLPLPRPEGLGEPVAEQESNQQADAATQSALAADASTPEPEPDRTYQAACPALLSGRVIGEVVPPIWDGGCGLQSPIAVSALVVNGRQIPLSGVPITNCAMATTLAAWVEEVNAYARVVLDTEIKSLSTGSGYQCRLRNGASTGFVSEHAFGNAIDIMAVSFSDGTQLSVLEDWDERASDAGAQVLGFAHSAACGRFTTVLGPKANAAHENHFHFDLSCHGRTCTYQLCE